MKRYNTVPQAAGVVILGLTLLLVLLAGWHREMISRYPLADLPYVNANVLTEQVNLGNISRTEALYYRKNYAGADTAEIR